MIRSLCESCVSLREVVTARSRFLLCHRSRTDAAFPKYPPQPIVQCGGYQPGDQHEDESKPPGE